MEFSDHQNLNLDQQHFYLIKFLKDFSIYQFAKLIKNLISVLLQLKYGVLNASSFPSSKLLIYNQKRTILLLFI
jgi:hypothetical protein